jgi:O-antigen/teichoic acid export membrane protein
MTSYKGTILRNMTWLTGSQVIVKLMGYIVIVLLARTLGDEGLGQHTFIFAFASITFLASDMGLNHLMVRDVSRDSTKAQTYFENIFTIKIILALVSLLLTYILSHFLGKEPIVVRSLWIASIIQVLYLFSYFITHFFNAFNRMEVDAKAAILEKIAIMCFGLYFLLTTESLLYFVFGLSLAACVKLLYLVAMAKGKIRFRLSFDLGIWKEMLGASYPFFLSSVFAFLLFRIDTVMLSLMQGDAATGWYNSAYRLLDLLSIIPGIIVAAIFPSMSRLYREDTLLLKKLFERAFRYLLMLVMPIVFGSFILAGRFIDFIYGDLFTGGTLALQILIWAEIFVFVNYLMGFLLNSIDKQLYFTKVTGVAALANIVLNFVLIPKFSFVGAGISTVVAQLLIFFLLRKYVGDFLVRVRITPPVTKSLIASLVMSFVIYQLIELALWYVVPIGAATYVLVLVLLKLEKEDRELIVEGLRRL